jgi:hypothetical protein
MESGNLTGQEGDSPANEEHGSGDVVSRAIQANNVSTATTLGAGVGLGLLVTPVLGPGLLALGSAIAGVATPVIGALLGYGAAKFLESERKAAKNE